MDGAFVSNDIKLCRICSEVSIVGTSLALRGKGHKFRAKFSHLVVNLYERNMLEIQSDFKTADCLWQVVSLRWYIRHAAALKKNPI